MNCRGCGGANRDGARFCTFCGAVLTLTCSSCGTDLLEGARFCDSCGSPVAVEPAAEPVAAARKVVTVLFADMTGSTSLEEEMDAEAVRSLVDRFYAALRAEVDKRGGRVVKFTGDGLMAAFGVPEVHEDDASRAIEAALGMCAACGELARETGHLSIALKVGVNTGEVVVIEDEDDVVGDSVNVAARLEGAAQPGEVLVGEGTWRLTRATSRYESIEPLILKGKAEPVTAYRLLAIDESAADSVATPFVGRADELELLVSVFDEAVAANAARLVTIVGSPGLGKTRLTRELAVRLADRALVRETRCDPAGSATFAPIAETLRAAASIPDTAEEAEVIAALEALVPGDDPDRERIASRAAAIFGIGIAGSTEETFWALRRLIETAARDHPRVLVLDDLHWGEPMLLDLVEHLAEWIHDAPVLLVGTGRPELRDIRPSLVEGGRASAVISLEGLDERATEQLALGMLGTDEVPRELLTKIPASTDGNPLFVRELVRMLIDDGVLRRDGDGWSVTVDVDAIEVPPTIQSLLAARMDRLRGDERTVIELASVIGKEFYHGAIHALAPSAVREQLDACLESLRRKELVEPAGAFWIDEPVFRFHHALIRDAAYRRLLKDSRADLHERVAEWLEEKTGDVIGEHEEVIGYHLEQAHEYHRQLGRLDERAVAVGRRAAALLGQAAQRALDRDDLPAAATLSGRALTRLPFDDPERPALLIVRVEALLSMGDVVSGRSAVEELERLADSPRLSAWATCFAGQLANLVEPERLRETEKRVAAAASELADLGDPAGAAKAHTVHASTLARLGRFAECESALDEALTSAREAGDRRRVTAVLGAAPLAALWGPSPVSRAGGRCLDIVRLLRITTGSPAVEATSTRCQAVLEAFRGRADAARKMLRNARGTLEELGLRHELLETEQFAGIVELVAGDAAAAEPHLRTAHDGFRFIGVDVSAAQSAALLARTHLQLGEIEEAESFAEESERLAGQDLKASIAWRAVRAEVLARRGAFVEARALAESAVEIAARTDALIDHGDACRALSVVCAAAEDGDGARSASDRAFALYERKGATALTELPTASDGKAEVTRSTHQPHASNVLVNDSTRLNDKIGEFFAKRDWAALDTLYAPDALFDDRRRGLRHSGRGPGAFLESLRPAAATGTARFDSVPIAVRGERLSLIRMTAKGRGGPAGLETQFLAVQELDPEGHLAAMVNFDPDALNAAVAELDERFIAGEGAAHAEIVGIWNRYQQAYNSRDWAAFRELLSDDVVVVDERPASLGRIEGANTYIRAMAELIELIPGRRGFISNFPLLGARGGVATFELSGATADGALTTETMHMVGLLTDARFSQTYHFPPEQLDAAIARFGQLDPASSHQEPVVEAFRAIKLHFDRLLSRDWDGLRALYAPSTSHEDRRSGFGTGVRSGRDELVAAAQVVAEIGVDAVDCSCVATRGNRLALARCVYRGSGAGANVEVETLRLAELDDQGRMSATILFDPGDLDAAFDELERRFVVGEGADAAEMLRLAEDFLAGLNAHDWEALREMLAEDLVLVDHRLVGLGEIHGREAWIESAKTMTDLTSAHRARIVAYHALSPGAGVAEVIDFLTTEHESRVETSYHLVGRVRDGAAQRLELFLLEDLDGALRRFEELSRLRVSSSVENACTRALSRLSETFANRDWEGCAEVFAEDVVHEDRRSVISDPAVGRSGVVSLIKSAADIGTVSIAWEPIATRGQRLALFRVVMAGRDIGTVTFGMELLQLVELDEQGLVRWSVSLDEDALDAAFAELDERYLAEIGEAYRQMLDAATGLSRATSNRDVAGVTEFVTEDFTLVDHTPAGVGELASRDEFLGYRGAMIDLITDRSQFIAAIHALRPGCALVQLSSSATTADGTLLEFPRLVLAEFREGRVARMEMFPLEQLEDALGRFEELEPGKSVFRLENASTAWVETFIERFNPPDWDGMAEMMADDARWTDQRPGLRAEQRGREGVLEVVKAAADYGPRTMSTAIAVRGERLALFDVTISGDAGFEVESLYVVELNDEGRLRVMVTFSPDDLDAAFAELDERYAVGDGRRYEQILRLHAAQTGAYNRRDWDAFRGTFHDDYVMVDHRPAGAGTLSGSGEQTQYVQTLIELAPDARLDTIEIIRIAPDRMLSRQGVRGTTAASAKIELTFLSAALQRAGRHTRLEVFPVEKFDEALACFEDLGRTEQPRLSNASVGAFEQEARAFEARDWDGVAGLVTEDIAVADRRQGVGFEYVGRDALIDAAQALASVRAVTRRLEIVAVRGDRLALLRLLVGPPDGAPGFESEVVILNEVDEAGRSRDRLIFDPADLDAAFAELDERFIAGEGAPFAEILRVGDAQRDALRKSDWDAYRAVMHEDVVLVDHRPASLDELRGFDAVFGAVRGFSPLVLDVRFRVLVFHNLAIDRVLIQMSAVGTAEHGGEVETSLLRLQQLRDGRVVRIELFPVEALDDALVRFDELGRDAIRPLDPHENAASRVGERAMGYIVAADWDAFSAAHSPTIRLEDRRSGLRWEGSGREALLDRAREHSSVYGHVFTTVLATRGDRLALGRQVLTSRDSGAWESERLIIDEIDESGLLTFIAFFDPTDLDAAFSELDERYAQGEGQLFADMVRGGAEVAAALNTRDWVTFASSLWPDMVLIDHRPASMGEIHGRDELVRAVKELGEIVPDVRYSAPRVHALGPNASVVEWLVQGTNVEGGAVEIAYLQVGLARDGRGVRIERYAVEQIDAALERFEELAQEHGTQAAEESAVHRVPENAASRADQEVQRCLEERDWQGFKAVHATDVRLEDRRPGLRWESVGIEQALARAHEYAPAGDTSRASVRIAVRGDRLALVGKTLTDSAEWHAERLLLEEVDDDGRLVFVAFFDGDDFDAAFAELDERFLAYAHGPEATRLGLELLGAYNGRDWEQFQALLTEDFVLVDHRPAGRGTVQGGEAYMALSKGLIELVPDVRMRLLGVHHEQGRLMLATTQSHGTDEHGNSVEYYNVNILRGSGRRISRLEFFLPEQFRSASVRFDELSAQESE